MLVTVPRTTPSTPDAGSPGAAPSSADRSPLGAYCTEEAPCARAGAAAASTIASIAVRTASFLRTGFLFFFDIATPFGGVRKARANLLTRPPGPRPPKG